MNSNFKEIFFCIVFLAMLLLSMNSVFCEENGQPDYLEIYLISINSDIRDHIEYLESPACKDIGNCGLIKEGMLQKYRDLVQFLPETKHIETISRVCDSQKKLFSADIIKLSNNCKIYDYCEGAYYVERICTAKNPQHTTKEQATKGGSDK